MRQRLHAADEYEWLMAGAIASIAAGRAGAAADRAAHFADVAIPIGIDISVGVVTSLSTELM
jgi:hypothetical protein